MENCSSCQWVSEAWNSRTHDAARGQDCSQYDAVLFVLGESWGGPRPVSWWLCSRITRNHQSENDLNYGPWELRSPRSPLCSALVEKMSQVPSCRVNIDRNIWPEPWAFPAFPILPFELSRRRSRSGSNYFWAVVQPSSAMGVLEADLGIMAKRDAAGTNQWFLQLQHISLEMCWVRKKRGKKYSTFFSFPFILFITPVSFPSLVSLPPPSHPAPPRPHSQLTLEISERMNEPLFQGLHMHLSESRLAYRRGHGGRIRPNPDSERPSFSPQGRHWAAEGGREGSSGERMIKLRVTL